MKLALNNESVSALRTFAEAMPFAIESITQSTEKVVQVYQSVADSVGPHEQDFYNMLLLIKKAQEAAAEAIQVLPPMLILTADKIEGYIYNIPQASGDGGSDSDSTPSIGAKTLRMRR